MMKSTIVAGLMASVFAVSAQAGDPAQLYQQAEQLWQADRTTVSQIDQVIQLLESAKRENADTELKYKVRIFLSKAVYWKGMNVSSDDQKKELFLAALQVANEAKALSDDYAEGYHFAAIARGRWGEVNGPLASLRYKQEVMDNCAGAKERITLDGEAGETVDLYGPDRTLGRVFFKLPSFAGGSAEQSRKHLELAHRHAPNHVLNGVYLAEVLYGGNSADKARARSILDAILAKAGDPASINPDRVPEMVDELKLARELRSGM